MGSPDSGGGRGETDEDRRLMTGKEEDKDGGGENRVGVNEMRT